jgi:hypothetical protein
MEKDEVVDKWLPCVLHLDTLGVLDRNVFLQMANRLISQQEYQKYIDDISKKSFGAGAAVWMEHDNRDFLISAAHVFFREGDMMTPHQKLFLVPREGQHFGLPDIPWSPTLSNFAAGSVENAPYEVEGDLLVMDLSLLPFNGLPAHLRTYGYEPIRLKDIDNEFAVKDGNELQAIGFPMEHAILSNEQLEERHKRSASPLISIPVVSEGTARRVNDHPRGANLFSANMSLTGGNSGGPILCGGQLVGIVSGNDSDLKLSRSTMYRTAEFALIKSPLIYTLIDRIDERRRQFSLAYKIRGWEL